MPKRVGLLLAVAFNDVTRLYHDSLGGIRLCCPHNLWEAILAPALRSFAQTCLRCEVELG